MLEVPEPGTRVERHEEMGTMGAVVVYESMYGNTRQVAEAVADGIRGVMPTELVEVGHAPGFGAMPTAELVVVGAPTHAMGLSRVSTRQEAQRRVGREVLSSGRGVREWLDQGTRTTLRAAAFDTHTAKPDLPGHAGRGIEKRLARLGCWLLTGYESFAVNGYDGPLCDGELERARAWGARVASYVPREVHPVSGEGHHTSREDRLKVPPRGSSTRERAP